MKELTRLAFLRFVSDLDRDEKNLMIKLYKSQLKVMEKIPRESVKRYIS